jgi:hypothetical protein
MWEIQQELRRRRNQFLLGIVNKFELSGENQTLFNCYDYVKIFTKMTMDSFIDSLTENQRDLLITNVKVWFLPIESISTFNVFLSNNEINLKQ